MKIFQRIQNFNTTSLQNFHKCRRVTVNIDFVDVFKVKAANHKIFAALYANLCSF